MSENREGSPMSEGETEHSHISTGKSQSSNHIVEERRDLADTFELFKVYFDNKLVDLKSDLVREQDVISKKLKEEVSLKFKHEGNKIQYKFNEETITKLNKSDTSAGGWAAVREYEANVIASDSEDEKKIRQAESRAMRTAKGKSRRPHPYKTTSRPAPVETAPNPYYVNQYQRQNPPPFRVGSGRREPSQHDMCHAFLYFDDGFGMNNDNNECIKDAEFVKQSLLNAGFLLNEEKSVFTPVQKLEWLGIIWDSCNFTLSIPQRRIDELLKSIHNVFREIPYISARNLAQVTGRIISMSPVIGNITRIMTRYCYMSTESRMSWDSYLVLESKSFVISELKFWLDNIANVNVKTLNQYSQSHVMIYSDASSIAAGACTVELESKIFHTMWKSSEMLESSTWRELKAIELAGCLINMHLLENP
ncbi:unnamed protein product [Mytilus coruscus]|uniref:Uncharacterized protein n=1 Tax=Mytilus coruscus TaxID=42192 RepID=A0A6J8A9P4_MYTCO|nr:unnamed protein product [Mytilus coruscus]